MGVTKAVGERFGKGGIADRAIWANGFPFLDNKEEHTFGVPVSQVMTTNIITLPASGMQLRDVEKILANNDYSGYPIVENQTSKTMLGYIGRIELRYAIDRVRRLQTLPPTAKCFFTPASTTTGQTPSTPAAAISFDTMEATSAQMTIDISRFVDPTPLAVHPRLPLETVMELFKKMGPRVILVEYRGRLIGLITVKDCLKYQFKVEAEENPRDDSHIEERGEKLWAVIKGVAEFVGLKVGLGRGKVRLSEGHTMGAGGLSPGNLQNRQDRERQAQENRDNQGLELEDR